jgi:hypothetical protein
MSDARTELPKNVNFCIPACENVALCAVAAAAGICAYSKTNRATPSEKHPDKNSHAVAGLLRRNRPNERE